MRTRGARLRKARKDAGYKTMRDAVNALGVIYSTYAGHETDARDYGPDEAAAYAKRFKVDVGFLLTGQIANSPQRPSEPRLAMVPVTGIVRAGAWQDVETGDSDLYKYVPGALDWPAEWQFAYTVEGTSLNKKADPGDVLICLSLILSGIDIVNHDLVIVERSRFGGQMIERTAKRVTKTLSGFELWPESDDPAHQEPIILNGTTSGDDEIRVTGKVLWIMKRP